jgi:hypothetical protein
MKKSTCDEALRMSRVRVSMHRSIRIIWTRRLVFNIWQLLWKLSITHWKPKFAD